VAASHTVPNPLSFRKSGVITLWGYGISVTQDRGHLLLKDGIASDRREIRLPRVAHGLKRLVIIGSDGMITLSALRWLATQGAAFIMLERNGKVLTVCGPVSSSDARLRRAQALAAQTGKALEISRALTIGIVQTLKTNVLGPPGKTLGCHRWRSSLG